MKRPLLLAFAKRRGQLNIISLRPNVWTLVYGYRWGLDSYGGARAHYHQHGTTLTNGFVTEIYANHGVCA